MKVVRIPMRLWFLAAVVAVGSAHAAPPAKAVKVDAGKLYQQECARCHGATGKGEGEDGLYYTTKPTDFTVASKRTDEFLAAVILEGGTAKGLSADMPAFKLSPDEIKALVAKIHQFAAKAK